MFCLILGLQASAAAQCSGTEIFTDKDGNGLWSDGNNWNPTTPQGGPNGNCSVSISLGVGGPTGGAILDVSASIVNLSLTANAGLSITAGSTLTITGSSISNGGQITIADVDGFSGGGEIGIANTVTLFGTGSTIFNAGGPIDRAQISGTGKLINEQKINGQAGGSISVSLQNKAPNGQITGGPLTVPLLISGAVTNTGTISGIGTSAVEFYNNTVQNAGGTVDATDSGQVLLDACTIVGGTIGSASTVAGTAFPTLNGATITGTYNVTSTATQTSATILEGTITNNGQIVLTSPPGGEGASLAVYGSVSLAGTGNVTLNGANASIVGTGTLTNVSPHVINGGGGSMTVSDVVNQSKINGPITIANKTVNNAGGTINNPTLINGGSVQNGTVAAGVNPGMTAEGGVTFSGVNITGGSQGVVSTIDAVFDGRTTANTISTTVQIPDGDKLILKGLVVVNSPGEIYVDAVTNPTMAAVEDSSVTMTGNGQLVSSSSFNNFITEQVMAGTTRGGHSVMAAAGSTNSLTINLPTVNFQGTIGDGSFPITFGATTTTTNGGYPLIINATDSTFHNLGTMVETDGTIEILGNFTNYNSSTDTLSGGTYDIGNGTLQFNNANVVTNAAKISLTGNGQIVNQNGVSGLTNLSTTTSKGTFALSGEQNFATVGTYTNQGANTIAANSVFTVGGTSTNYNQSGTNAVTTVDGRISVPAGGLANITGGTLQGAGQFDGDVSVGNTTGGAAATFIVGDSKKSSALVTMENNYAQLGTGVMDVQIGGTTVGSQYSQINVTGPVTLGGTLNVTLINKFKPVTGDQFTVVNAPSGVTGTFATVNLPPNFQVVYNSTSVELNVQ